MKRFILISFVLTSLFCKRDLVYGQIENISVINYTTDDYGLDQPPEIYCTVQAQNGFMYFGSANGVLEFDGKNWRLIKVVVGEYVRSLVRDSVGNIYAGSMGDFGIFNADSMGNLKFVSFLSLLKEEDRYFSDIWYTHATSDFVFFQSQECLFVYDINNGFIEVVYPPDFSSFHTSFLVDDELYLRTREIGLQKYNGAGELETLTGTEFIKNLGVFGLYKEENDSLLIVTQEIGIWKWKGEKSRQLTEKNSKSFIEYGVYGTNRLSDGNIALQTFTDGVYVMKPSGEIINHFDKANGLKSNDIKNIYTDMAGNIWLATGNGVSVINYFTPFSSYGTDAGIEGAVWCAKRFKNKLFVGTSYGLYQETTNRFIKFQNTNLLNSPVNTLITAGNKLFIGTANAIYSSSDGISVKKEVGGVDINMIQYVDNKDVFLVGGGNGFIIYSTEFEIIYEFEKSFSKVIGIEADPQDSSLIWLGTVANGIYKIRYEDTITVDHYGDKEGLIDDFGVPLLYHDTLIFGGKTGLEFFYSEEKMRLSLNEEQKKDPVYYKGMLTEQDFHGRTYESQFLFMETSNTYDWYSKNNFSLGLYDHSNNEFLEQPFRGVNIGRINFFYSDNEFLFAGSVKGLIKSTNRWKTDFDDPFSTVIRQFKIHHDSVLFFGSFYSDGIIESDQPKSLTYEIDYEFNEVYFKFVAPYFDSPEKIKYSVRLEGYDDEWSEWTQATDARYTNLPEGNYTFQVKALNVYDIESKVGALRFKINPPWYRTIWAYILYALAFVFVLLIGIKLSSIRLKQKNQRLETIVSERTREIKEKSERLQVQNKEIEDSINYAQRIQEAILPLEREMKKWIPDAFVLFQPKDIVSGDFYWFMEKDGKLVFVCADCTGHGVPGAFMSMIGSDRLNNIVSERKITSPGLILSELNRAIKKSLKQDGHKNSTKDGMDAAICTIDIATNTMLYSGANRALWILQNDELSEIKATKVAVAGFTDDDQVYTEHKIVLEKGKKFYLSTDGYADQFGGEFDKKFKVKNMKSLILEIHKEKFYIQKEKLEQNIAQWMGDVEQIDDICVIGFEPRIEPIEKK